MPKYEFAYHREEGYKVTFEADSREHAEWLLEEINTGAMDVHELPEVEQEIVHGVGEILLPLRELK